MEPTTYVLADPQGRLHLVSLPEEADLEIPLGWTYLADADAEARFWAESRAAEERYGNRVSALTAELAPGEQTAEARTATVASVEARFGLAPGTLAAALPESTDPVEPAAALSRAAVVGTRAEATDINRHIDEVRRSRRPPSP